MRWLAHGTLTPAVTEALVRHGHHVTRAEEVFAEPKSSAEVLEYAKIKQLEVITNDPLLARAPFEEGLGFGGVIVFLQLSGEDVEQDDAVDRLFERYKRLTRGRLYTLTASRAKVRQLPGAK